MSLPKDLPSRTARAVFTFLMATAWTGAIPVARGAQQASPPAGRGPEPAAAKAAAEQVERLLRAMEAANRELPRDEFDPQAIVERVGRDPAKLFAWVRDNTHWVAYRGALRGSTGVLMDRLGNSLDRASLLADLLAGSGKVVRLAQAAVPPPRAAELLAKVRPVPANWLAAAAANGAADNKPAGDGLRAYAARFGLDAEQLLAANRRAGMDAAAQAERGVERTAEQAPALAAVVAAAVRPPAAANDKARAAAAAAVADHWWVQVKDGSGWTDFDPLLPDAAPGTTAATRLPPARTVDVGPAGARPPADAAFWHEVEVRVVVERTAGGKATEAVPLAHTLRPAQLFGHDVHLSFPPTAWPKDVTSGPAKNHAAQFKAAVLAQAEWLPTLRVGRTHVANASVKDTGELNDSPGGEAAGKIGSAAGRALGGFGGGLAGGGDDAGPAAKSYLSAQWIEYVVRAPGEAPLTFRREVFDLAGPAARATRTTPAADVTPAQRLQRGAAMLGRAEILPLGCRMSPKYVEHLTARRMVANRPAYAAMLKDPWKSVADLNQRMGKVDPLPGPTYGLAVARDAWNPEGGDVYLDRPNVLTHRSGPRVNAAGEFVMCAGFDIVENAVAVRPGAADPFGARLRQGVCDTSTEGLLVGGCGKVQNTAELFALAPAPGGEWVTLTKASAPADLDALGLEPDVRARLAADLAAGQVVVAPRRAAVAQAGSAYAWWRVDPTTGQTLGIGRTGEGAGTVEYTITVFYTVTAFLVCSILAGLDSDGITVKDSLACAFGAVTGGGGLGMAVAAGSGIGATMAIFTIAMIGIGLDKNKDIPDK